MIVIELLDRRSWTRYRVAGVDVVVDLELPQLGPFRIPDGTAEPAAADAEADPGSDLELVFAGAGSFGGGRRAVRCESGGGRYRLTVEGRERFAIGPAGIARLGARGAAVDEEVVQAVLGPGLALALALRGVFCLHASAVRGAGGAVLFAGRSGAGKSTLARFLHEDARTSWERISDDVTPVRGGAEGSVALPRFPQLALAGTGGARAGRACAPERLPLRAFHALADRDAAQGEPVASIRLDPTRAAAAIVQSTIALPLLARRELGALLELAATIATELPVSRLERVRGLEHLPAIAELLRADLADPGLA